MGLCRKQFFYGRLIDYSKNQPEQPPLKSEMSLNQGGGLFSMTIFDDNLFPKNSKGEYPCFFFFQNSEVQNRKIIYFLGGLFQTTKSENSDFGLSQGGGCSEGGGCSG